MRISSNTFQRQFLSSVGAQQASLSNVQRQVNTGRRIASAADDPAGAAQVVLLQNGVSRLDNFATNAETARRRLALEETVLDQTTNILNRVRDLVIQASDGPLSPEAASAISGELNELLKDLLGAANSQDGEGRYLFSGNRVQIKPFDSVNGSFVYNGDNGSRTQRIGENRNVQEADPGSTVFSAVHDGNGTFAVEVGPFNAGSAYYSAASVTDPAAWVPGIYTINFTSPTDYTVTAGGNQVTAGTYAPGEAIAFNGISITVEGSPSTGDSLVIRPSRNQDMFKSVQNLISDLRLATGGAADRARLTSQLNSSLLNIDQALGRINDVRSQVGARLNLIDRQSNNNEEMGLQLAQALSNVRDVDYAKALSSLEQQLFSLEAAQKTFARTRTSSLFNIL